MQTLSVHLGSKGARSHRDMQLRLVTEIRPSDSRIGTRALWLAARSDWPAGPCVDLGEMRLGYAAYSG